MKARPRRMNALWERRTPTGEATRLRVLREDVAGNRFCVIPMIDGTTAVPAWLDGAEIETLREAGLLNDVAASEVPALLLPAPDEWTAVARETHRANSQLLTYLRRQIDSYLDSKSARSLLISKATGRFKCSARRVRDVATRYLTAGENISAIFPKFSKCGNPGQNRTPALFSDDPKLHAIDAKQKGSRLSPAAALTDVDFVQMDSIIAKYVLTSSKEQRSIGAAYRRLLSTFYTTNVDAVVNAGAEPEYTAVRPGRWQFRYRAKKSLQSITGAKRRAGERYRNDHRPATRSPGREQPGPGAVLQVDSTLLDMPIIYGYGDDGTVLCKRPTLYLARDWWSGLYVGYVLSLGAPSRDLLGQLLWAVAVPKTLLQHRWGFLMPPPGWNAEGLYASVLTDRGSEYMSLSVEAWVKDLGFIGASLPRRTPDMKGLIESGLRVVQTDGIHGEDGALSKAESARGLKRGPPNNDFQSLSNIIVEIIVKLNHKAVPFEQLDIRAVKSGVTQITRQDYHNWGIEFYGDLASTADPIDLERRLLPRNTATVTRDGFKVNGLLYLPTESNLEDFFMRRTSAKKKPVSVSEDWFNVGNVWLWHGADKPLEPLVLSGNYEIYDGLTIKEAKEKRKRDVNAVPGFKEKEEQRAVASEIRRAAIRQKGRNARKSERKENAKAIVETLTPRPIEKPRPTSRSLSPTQARMLRLKGEPT
jgi:hypothetical protein